ncbi:hypothetical protein ACFSYD_01500 [Paracoccus aerius]
MDFREGGYVFSRHKVKREFSYDQGGWDDQPQRGAGRPAADAPGNDGLTARFARVTHYLGAVASVALMVGLMVWGWQLVSRDVSGVPVIRAITGDARTAPAEPGGELTNYTGYAVNTVAEGVDHQPTQQVAIAPAPVGLSDEDVAMGQLGATRASPRSCRKPRSASTGRRSCPCPTAKPVPWRKPRPRRSVWPWPTARCRKPRLSMRRPAKAP